MTKSEHLLSVFGRRSEPAPYPVYSDPIQDPIFEPFIKKLLDDEKIPPYFDKHDNFYILCGLKYRLEFGYKPEGSNMSPYIKFYNEETNTIVTFGGGQITLPQYVAART